jgi:flavodoxin/Pyruvate/2-oxoacid:ferredoxin oxidoreductase delta subunit
MKSIVIYYSWTGNTKRIAEAIHSGMRQLDEQCDIVPLREVDTRELINYDLIGLGALVIDFQEPDVVTDFINDLPPLKGKYGFTFCTHGTCPGEYIARTVKSLRRKGLTITGWNDWYGSVFIPYIPKPYYTDEIVKRSQRISKGETKLIPRLPAKETYEKLYGARPVYQNFPGFKRITQEEWDKLKPRLNIEKCKYPKCSICVDNCPTRSINPAASTPISYHTCEPCQLWFCEQLCPAGAIEVDWEPVAKRRDFQKFLFSKLAEPMKEYKSLRRFRSLVPSEKEGQDKPLYKIKKRPRLIIRNGVVRVRS